MTSWYAFREVMTGRWMADEDGQTWTNLPQHAFKFFRIHDLYWEFAVLPDPDFSAIWTDSPDLPSANEQPFERILAKAYKFCLPQRVWWGYILGRER